MRALYRQFVQVLRDTSEDVGDRFADEARKIHYRETEARGRDGEATGEEAKALIDEGIDCQPLPTLPDREAAIDYGNRVAVRRMSEVIHTKLHNRHALGLVVRLMGETYAALQPKYGRWVIFDHCMPVDVTRAYDEATRYPDPRIWTAERDIEMWKTLEG